MNSTKTLQIGHGIFLFDEKDIKIRSEYAKKKLKEGKGSLEYFFILEREATTEIQNATHGRSRHEIYLEQKDDFLAVMKELNPKKYKSYLKMEKK